VQEVFKNLLLNNLPDTILDWCFYDYFTSFYFDINILF
jgi:hypothetical protein